MLSSNKNSPVLVYCLCRRRCCCCCYCLIFFSCAYVLLVAFVVLWFACLSMCVCMLCFPPSPLIARGPLYRFSMHLKRRCVVVIFIEWNLDR